MKTLSTKTLALLVPLGGLSFIALGCDASPPDADPDTLGALSDADVASPTACTAGLCSGAGTCIESAGAHTCVCDPGYDGDTCAGCAEGYHEVGGVCLEQFCGATSCGGRGTCDDSSGTVQCDCDEGYAPPDCAVCAAGYHVVADASCKRVASCDDGHPCVHGTCDDSAGTIACVCDVGYIGATCSDCYPGYERDGETDECLVGCVQGPGWGRCDGVCRDLTRDPDHCGACDEACPDGRSCADRECAPVPPNDTCAEAITLLGFSGTRTVDTLFGATAQSSDCGGAEVFYTVTVSEPSWVYLDTFGSGFATQIAYRGEDCGAAVTCVEDACDRLESQLVQLVEPGTHFFSIHTAPGATPGALSLRWQTMPASKNTNTRIFDSGAYPGDLSSGATIRTATCAPQGAQGEDSFVFTVCPDVTYVLTAHTCTATTFDTVIEATGPAGPMTCNDDASYGCGQLQSRISFIATGPGLWEVLVERYSGGSTSGATYTLTVEGL